MESKRNQLLVMELGGIKIQKEKVAGVLEWPEPKMVKEVQKFLGLTNYFKDFAKIAKPIYKFLERMRSGTRERNRRKCSNS